jgi:murein DD-endopeptidase MepM/ murein hydrolase activator NlpD
MAGRHAPPRGSKRMKTVKEKGYKGRHSTSVGLSLTNLFAGILTFFFIVTLAGIIFVPTFTANNGSFSAATSSSTVNSSNTNDSGIAPDFDVIEELQESKISRLAVRATLATASTSATQIAESDSPDVAAENVILASGVTPSVSGRVGWPTDTRVKSSSFGFRSDPFTGVTKFHTGFDIPAACGSKIYAAESGVVSGAGNTFGNYGNRVVLTHSTTLITAYSHLQTILVQRGDTVVKGQLIAYMGTTGRSTGCHLHFEVGVNGHWTDPLPWLTGTPGSPATVAFGTTYSVRSAGTSTLQTVASTPLSTPIPSTSSTATTSTATSVAATATEPATPTITSTPTSTPTSTSVPTTTSSFTSIPSSSSPPVTESASENTGSTATNSVTSTSTP